MIDAIEIQLGPVDLASRTYARQQPGCRTLIEKIYGIGEQTSVTILAELGDPRRFQNSRDAVRYSGLELGDEIVAMTSPDRSAPTPPGSRLAGAGFEQFPAAYPDERLHAPSALRNPSEPRE